MIQSRDLLGATSPQPDASAPDGEHTPRYPSVHLVQYLFLLFSPPRFTIKTCHQVLKAITFSGKVAGMQLKFGGGEAGFGHMRFADQFALLVHAQTIHAAVAVFQRRIEGRGVIAVTGRASYHQPPQEPGVLGLEDMQAVRAAIGKLHA